MWNSVGFTPLYNLGEEVAIGENEVQGTDGDVREMTMGEKSVRDVEAKKDVNRQLQNYEKSWKN